MSQDETRLIETGHALEAQGRLDAAMQCYLDAVRIAPNPARAHLNRGNVMLLNGDLEGSLEAFRTAIKFKPDYAGAYYNIGNALLGSGKFDMAVDSYRSALDIQPDYAEVHCGLGVALKEIDMLDEAMACFREALRIDHDLVEARLNLGSLLLAQGRYAEAWPEYETRYDHRYAGRQSIPPVFPFPRWQGEDLTGKSLVVWPEQGFGDSIQFARYFPMLKSMGVSKLTVVCRPQLEFLLKQTKGVDAVIDHSSAASLPLHDYWTFQMSLPLRFSTTVGTIPADLPYLAAPAERVDRWSDALQKDRCLVGLVWKGSPGHQNDANRSIHDVSMLDPLWSVRGVTYVSLQKETGDGGAASPHMGGKMLHLGRDMLDFADAAAIIDQLDIVICVDTAIAHLAGSMGKLCWVMLPAIGTDWRWFRGRTDSPWYPGVMKLFRQGRYEGWSETISDVARELQKWVDDLAVNG